MMLQEYTCPPCQADALIGVGVLDESSDAQLLGQFVDRGDQNAFAELMRRHGPLALGVCRRMLRNEQDAEDAFQATFLILARRAASIRRREVVGSWLYGVAYRAAMKARTMIRRHGKEKQHDPMLSEPMSTEPSNDWNDLQVLLDIEVERLPEKYRAPVVLCDLEGQSRKDVAQQLDLPEGTLSSRLNSARKILAKRLNRRGVLFSASALVFLTENVATAAVPDSLMASTLNAVGAAGTGKLAASGMISTTVVSLTEGVLQAMFLSKLKTALSLVLVFALLIGGGATGLQFVSAQPAGKKDDSKKAEPKKSDSKAEPKAKTDHFPQISEKVKKYEADVLKLRAALLKEIADEDAKLTEAIKTADAEKGKDAFRTKAELTRKKMELGQIRFHVEIGRVAAEKAAAELDEEHRLGVRFATMSATTAQQLGLDASKGLVLERVDADSPAAKAGLKAHDILVKLDGKAVPSSRKAALKLLAEIKTGVPVEAVVVRSGRQETVAGVVIPAVARAEKN